MGDGLVTGFLQGYGQLAKQYQTQIQQEVDNEMAQMQLERQNQAQQSLDQYRQGELAYRQQQDATRNKQIDQQGQIAQNKLDSQELRNQTTNWRAAFGNALKDPNATTFRDVLARAAFASPGYQPSQEDLQNAASLAGVTMNAPPPTPVLAPPGQGEVGPQGPSSAGQVGQLGGQPIPSLPTGQATPGPTSWMDQPLPMNKERIANMQALEVQRQAHAALQQQQADKLQRMAGLDQEIQQAQLAHVKAVTDLTQQRAKDFESNQQFEQWYKTGMLDARQAANDIANTRNQIYQQSINNIQNRSDRADARQLLSAQRGFLTKQFQNSEGEIKTLQNLIDKTDAKARIAAEYIKSAGETGQGDPAQVQAAQAAYLAANSTLTQLRKQLGSLQAEQSNVQGLIGQTFVQQNQNGTMTQPPPMKGTLPRLGTLGMKAPTLETQPMPVNAPKFPKGNRLRYNPVTGNFE